MGTPERGCRYKKKGPEEGPGDADIGEEARGAAAKPGVSSAERAGIAGHLSTRTSRPWMQPGCW